MIDLLNGDNGTNGKNDDAFIPCPSCVELGKILELIEEFRVSSTSTTFDIINLMARELLMFRAKSGYEKELRKQFISGMSKKIDEMEQ